MNITELIRMAHSARASDLHLSVASPPMLRVNGTLMPGQGVSELTQQDILDLFEQLTTVHQREMFARELELDFAFEVKGLVRIRCNAARQRGTISIAMRLIPTEIPGFDNLHLPEVCRELALKPRGLVVVSGPTGSGKSTTLAAMVDFLNRTQSRRIVTIEDPIEYVHSNERCVIIQRELGEDTLTFSGALKHVLRQDPDVILVGEMRDLETASAALMIAETGHLLLTTGHAPSSYQAVERIVDLFPMHERNLAQTRLASLLIGILCQTLLPVEPREGEESGTGMGRVPAIEVMLGNPAIKNLIREGKIHQLPNTMRTYSNAGMKLMDQSLVDLYKEGLVSAKSVLSSCNDKAEVMSLCPDIKATDAAGSAPRKPVCVRPRPQEPVSNKPEEVTATHAVSAAV